MHSVIWRTNSLSHWPVVTELGNAFLSLQLRSPEVEVSYAPGFPWSQDTSNFSLDPKSKLQPHRKVFEKTPISDSSLKSQTHENLPTSVSECAAPSSIKAGLPSWALPLATCMGKWGPYFTLEVAAFQEQNVIKKDEWQVISVTNTCTVHRDLFGRKGLC